MDAAHGSCTRKYYRPRRRGGYQPPVQLRCWSVCGKCTRTYLRRRGRWSGLPLSLPGPHCGPPRQAAAQLLRSLFLPQAALPCGPHRPAPRKRPLVAGGDSCERQFVPPHPLRPPCVKGAVSRQADWGIVNRRSRVFCHRRCSLAGHIGPHPPQAGLFGGGAPAIRLVCLRRGTFHRGKVPKTRRGLRPPDSLGAARRASQEKASPRLLRSTRPSCPILPTPSRLRAGQ